MGVAAKGCLVKQETALDANAWCTSKIHVLAYKKHKPALPLCVSINGGCVIHIECSMFTSIPIVY